MKRLKASSTLVLSIIIVYIGTYIAINYVPIFGNAFKRLSLASSSPAFLNVSVMVAMILTFIISLFITRFQKESIADVLHVHKLSLKYGLLSFAMGVLLALILITMNIFPGWQIDWTVFLYLTDSIKNQSLIHMMEVSAVFRISILRAVNSFAVYIAGIVCMEFVIRGLVLNQLKQMLDVKLAVLIQAMLTGLLFYNNPLGMLIGFLIGIILGMVCHRTKSIWSSLIVHITVVIFIGVYFMLDIISLFYRPETYSTAEIIGNFVQNETKNAFSFAWQQTIFLVVEIIFFLLIFLFALRRKKEKAL